MEKIIEVSTKTEAEAINHCFDRLLDPDQYGGAWFNGDPRKPKTGWEMYFWKLWNTSSKDLAIPTRSRMTNNTKEKGIKDGRSNKLGHFVRQSLGNCPNYRMRICSDCHNYRPCDYHQGFFREVLKMKDFWIMDTETGEEFFVECVDETDCWEILANEFDHIDRFEIVDVVTPAMAEIIGLDTL